jgi:hypothetical protein
VNSLNKSLQGSETNLIQLIDKVSAFKKKVLLWKRKINGGGEMNYFPHLQLFITENEIEFTANIVSVFERHLHDLSIHFEKYFPENCDRFQCVKNPFSSDAPSEFSTTAEEELIELSSDSLLKVKFLSMPLPTFWYSV